MKHFLKPAHSFIFVGTALMLTFVSSCKVAPLTIATNSKSTFTIVVPKLAAVSVTAAAIEMQRDIEEATGAKLPIQKDDETTTGPYISLGSTQQAKTANITTANLADDAFHTITKNGDLFFIGIDTTTEALWWTSQTPGQIILHPETPGPAYTDKGGFSSGTANGVYSFLEDQLNVRWIFPGDLGRDVPGKSTFTIPDLNGTVTPAFNYRIMSVTHPGDD
ncbi:MAG: hypothetical protein ABI210_07880 [Abditibacteriaceae bacterium]